VSLSKELVVGDVALLHLMETCIGCVGTSAPILKDDFILICVVGIMHVFS